MFWRLTRVPASGFLQSTPWEAWKCLKAWVPATHTAAPNFDLTIVGTWDVNPADKVTLVSVFVNVLFKFYSCVSITKYSYISTF